MLSRKFMIAMPSGTVPLGEKGGAVSKELRVPMEWIRTSMSRVLFWPRNAGSAARQPCSAPQVVQDLPLAPVRTGRRRSEVARRIGGALAALASARARTARLPGTAATQRGRRQWRVGGGGRGEGGARRARHAREPSPGRAVTRARGHEGATRRSLASGPRQPSGASARAGEGGEGAANGGSEAVGAVRAARVPGYGPRTQGYVR